MLPPLLSNSRPVVLSIAVSSIALIALTYRILLGVDFTDECLYIATTYRFVLGDRPFIDELGFTQMASVLLYPFYKIYYLVIGSTDGIVLFSRVLYVLFSLTVGIVIAVSAQHIIPRTLALSLILLCGTFLPFSIPSLSYNTLGMGFLTIGLYVMCTPYWSRMPAAPCLVVAGISHSLAVFVYPTHLLSVLAITLLLFCGCAGQGRHSYWYIVGGLIPVAVLLMLFLNVGVSDFEQSYRFVLSWGKHQNGFAKWSSGLAQIFERTPRWYLFLPAVALWSWTLRRWSPYALVPFVIVCLLCNYSGFEGHLRSMGLVIYLGLLTPVLLLFEDSGPFRKPAWFLWVASFIAGNVSLWSSANNAGPNAALGLFPAAVLTLICVIRNQLRTSGNTGRNLLLSLGAVTLVLVQFGLNSYSFLYRESPPQRLSSQVAVGPFRGLYTTPQRDHLIARLSKDVLSLASVDGNVLSFNRFPAGYLFTSMPPAVCSPWVENGGRQFYVESFLKKLGSGTITIVNKRMTGRPIEYSNSDPLLESVRENQQLRIDRSEYSIYFGLKENLGTMKPPQ
jgi:hypothetical protein